ncbi:MAG: penicillin-binding protein 1C [Bacteroidota bacterium]|nr:penicillin-binding protein 1C [Bacteroidota bacterium]
MSFYRVCKFSLISIFISWLAAIVCSVSLFDDLAFSKVLFDQNGELLSSRIAEDGQWRFPLVESIPTKYALCLLQFEDKRFYYHLGVDPIAILRASSKNFNDQKVVSGASTISMQVVRLARKKKQRNFGDKLVEIWLAVGLEFWNSKKEILNWYCRLAPFGGNVVGLETAVWRYYGKVSNDLSWAESALLAVLPNQPSWMHLNRNREKLLHKRNRLLKKLYEQQIIDEEIYELSLLEPIPPKPVPINRMAPHALDYLIKTRPEKYYFESTIDRQLQNIVNNISIRHHRGFKENDIHNIAAIVIENSNRNVRAYVGNAVDTGLMREAAVDMVHAPRSSGSILKPLLLACMLDENIINNKSLVADIPTLIQDFKPENFDRNYLGAVRAEEVIQKSLNVPSVNWLKEYEYDHFYTKLKSFGFSHLFRPAEDYGLSLILGGAEVSMWDLGKVYSGLAQTLLQYNINSGKYHPEALKALTIICDSTFLNSSKYSIHPPVISASSIYHMFMAMVGDRNTGLEFTSGISWKTGTSFGFKDAWCVGINPDYTVVCWIGNANGLARPGLIGIQTAAPYMFEIFSHLSHAHSWPIPYDDMKQVRICAQSGYLPGSWCNDVDTIFVGLSPNKLKLCPYHQKVFLDSTLRYRVFQDCYVKPKPHNYFVLPPAMEYYYKLHHSDYTSVPPLHPDCQSKHELSNQALDFIYPEPGATLYATIDLSGQETDIVFTAVHKNPLAILHWFMDDSYIMSSTSPHKLKVKPAVGRRTLMITDEEGHSAMRKITVLNRGSNK